MKRFASEDTDFRLLQDYKDGTGQSLQFDAFQVVLEDNQLRINLTSEQIDQLWLKWKWRME